MGIRQWFEKLWHKRNTLADTVFSQPIKIAFLQALPFWVASLFVGLLAVGYASLFNYSEHLLRSIYNWNKLSLFIITPLSFILAWWIVQRFAPNASGSGIPQVMAAIELATPKNNEKIKKLLSFRILVTKICSSLLMVLGGGAIGREGPTIQIAGSIFRIVSDAIPTVGPNLPVRVIFSQVQRPV